MKQDRMVTMLTTRFTAAIVSAVLCAAILAVSAQAQPFADLKAALVDYSKADLKPAKTCEALDGFKAKEIVTISAAVVPSADAVPAFCRVSGVLDPEIAFEVSLPEKWNGRFYMIGNGGHAGEALNDAGRVSQIKEALKVGFAVAQTDTGHDSRKEPGASFVMSNPQKAIDYAYRAVHLTAVTAKDIIRDYYGKPISYSYWNSCSNGGRQGLIEAQRFPEDFDGIVANAPWLDQTGFTIGAMWNQKALSEAPVNAAKMAMVAGKVMAKCDAIDGVKDGLIDDPRKCDFDPVRDVPACSAGGGHRQGLQRTGEQRQALFPRLHAGQRSRHAEPVRRRLRQRLDEHDRERAAGRQVRGFQPGGKYNALSRAETAETGLGL
jgi:hypothetical protein